jgi:hypothetical protein
MGRRRAGPAEPVDEVPGTVTAPQKDNKYPNRKQQIGEQGEIARPVVTRCPLDFFVREI